MLDKDICRDTQLRKQRQLLMDKGYPILVRRLRVFDLDLLPVEIDLSGVRLIVAAKNLHQRGFPGSVFADQSAHLALIQGKIHVPQRIYARESFFDPLHFQ